jgi:hypothetical protein
MKSDPQKETILNSIDLSRLLNRMLVNEILLHIVGDPLTTVISNCLVLGGDANTQVEMLPCNYMRRIDPNIAKLAVV